MEDAVTEDYFIRCIEGREEGVNLKVRPEGSDETGWETWAPCGQGSGQAEMIRGEDADRVYKGNSFEV